MIAGLSAWRFEPAGPAAGDAMAELHGHCFATPWSSKEFTALLHQSTSQAELAWSGRILAGLSLFRLAVDEAEILTICTHPDQQGRGLASKLLNVSEDRAEAAGIGRIILEVSTANFAARRVYDRAGYSEIACRKAYYSDGTDALILEKILREDGHRPG